MALSSRKRSTSLTHELVTQLTELIANGSLKPGDKLPTESSLMKEYGVSRTVVREAISRLQAAGLAETKHGVGTFVLAGSNGAPLILDAAELNTLEDVIEILELRISLEVESAALAAERRSESQLKDLKSTLDALLSNDPRMDEGAKLDFIFHSLIAKASGNRYFIDILNQFGNVIIPRNRIKGAALSESSQQAYLSRVNMEHEDIYLAIARQDPSAARAAMRLHLTNSKERHRTLYKAMQASEKQQH